MPLTPALAHLEAESLYILREAVAEARHPVMLYSVGKDSSVMLHLARKAFAPGRLPFPLLHVDTTWKFREMIAHRDRMVAETGVQLIVHTNTEGVAQGINPFEHGAAYTDIMKTQALKQALDHHGFDIIFGGARRDEEKSRAKERICSVRESGHQWNPKTQRPEFWSNFNTRLAPGQTLRVFPLSNWTEADIWHYIADEAIPVVPLYFAKTRPVVRRHGQWIMVDDERLPLLPDERVDLRSVRFRTLGCYPLTAAVESTAETLEAVIAETLATRSSERAGRLIDFEDSSAMERKKQEGYF
ncbi:MAG: sulfate adenylyltransferase subunit CysD [Burkholderiales bacterium]